MSVLFLLFSSLCVNVHSRSVNVDNPSLINGELFLSPTNYCPLTTANPTSTQTPPLHHPTIQRFTHSSFILSSCTSRVLAHL